MSYKFEPMQTLTLRNHKQPKNWLKQTAPTLPGVRRPVLLGCNKLSKQIVGKSQSASRLSFDKLISKAAKAICKLYLAYPSEVVSVLLEFFKMDDPNFCSSADGQLENYDRDGLKPLFISFNDMKTIITMLSNKEPRLVLSVLKAIIAMIEVQQSLKVVSSRNEKSKSLCEGSPTSNLSSFLLWLITTLKVFQETGNMSIVSEAALPSDKNSVPVFSLSKLFEKCLSLTVFGEENFINSALVLVDMVGDNTVKDKLKKLLVLGSQTWSTEDRALSNHETVPSEHETAIKKASENFEYLKL